MNIRLRFDIDFDMLGQTNVLLQDLLANAQEVLNSDEPKTVSELLFGKEKTLDELYSQT